MGPAADQAGRSVNNRLSGIMGTARGMIAAGWIIPLAFEFFDDMGRTPEQRIAQIGKNHEQYEKVAKAVEESSFGQWWTQLKASANNAMGLQAGEVPVDFFVAKFKKAADDMRAAIEPFRFDLAEIRDWKIDWSGLSPAAIIPFWTELATAVNSAVEALKGLREKFSLDNLLPEGVKDAKDASKGGADMGSRVGKPPEATAPAAPNASPDQARRAGDRFGRMIAPAQPPARLEGNITATIKVEGPGKVTSITSDNKNIRVDAAGRMLGRV